MHDWLCTISVINVSEVILAQIYFLYLWHVTYIYETKNAADNFKEKRNVIGVQNVIAFRFG